MAEVRSVQRLQDSIENSRTSRDLTTDTWATLVTHITGYPVPDRNTIFDTLRSDHGGKLFRMDIQELDLSLVVKDSGFLVNKGEDYDIYFFDRDKKMSIMQARIVFEGRVKAGDEDHLRPSRIRQRPRRGGPRRQRVHGLQQGQDEHHPARPVHERAAGGASRAAGRQHDGTPGSATWVCRRPTSVDLNVLQYHRGLLRLRGQVLQGPRRAAEGLGGPFQPGRRELEG